MEHAPPSSRSWGLVVQGPASLIDETAKIEAPYSQRGKDAHW